MENSALHAADVQIVTACKSVHTLTGHVYILVAHVYILKAGGTVLGVLNRKAMGGGIASVQAAWNIVLLCSSLRGGLS